jgi:hypothetical protein
MLGQDAIIATIAVPVISSLLFILGFYCGGLYQKRKCKCASRKRVLLQKPTPPPNPKEVYYNMPPSSEQDNDVEMREQRNVKPSCPAVMYDDVILSTSQECLESDFPDKSCRLVAMYDDIFSPSEQHDQLKEQNTKKPKVMYDEVLQPCEQECVPLKKNTAYRPAESKQSH